MSFGKWLASNLKNRGWSYSQFAQSIGVAPATVSRWAADKRIPDPATCLLIAEVLNVAQNEVLSNAGHENIIYSTELQLKMEIARLEHDIRVAQSDLVQMEKDLSQKQERLKTLPTNTSHDREFENTLQEIISNDPSVLEERKPELIARILSAFEIWHKQLEGFQFNPRSVEMDVWAETLQMQPEFEGRSYTTQRSKQVEELSSSQIDKRNTNDDRTTPNQISSNYPIQTQIQKKEYDVEKK